MRGLKNAVLTVNCQNGETVTIKAKTENQKGQGKEYVFEETERVQGVFTLDEIPGGMKGALNVKVKNGFFMENQCLETEKPFVLELELTEKPEKITAMYLYNDWWTRPAFITGFEDTPKNTQIAFLKYENRYACLVPMVGDAFKAYLAAGKENTVTMEITAHMGGMTSIEDPVFIVTEDENLQTAVEKAFAWIAEYKGIRRKGQKRLPEMFQYLGWCSWDAFYTDISEGKVREKAEELETKEVPVRWILMDDGWLSVEGERLYDYMPEKKKFPSGFRTMIDEIKSKGNINWFGVWHAFAGYWGGILPGSKLEKEEKEHLYYTANGKIIPNPENDKGFGFYRNWYQHLLKEGIDFVKVDGQSAVKRYFENSMPIGRAARGMHEALEGGASYMGGTIINCMGMAMENMISRPGTAVSRNSDDFFPNKEEGFKEHLLQNAYNAIYQDELYYCDWDMFWTSHPDCIKHSLLRAVSGGPVYFSDKIGETNPEVLKPLAYEDGKLLMMDRAAKPTEDCLFVDPFKEGVLKLTNVAPYGQNEKGGGVAVYNLTDSKQEYSFAPADVKELNAGQECWVYDYFKKEAKICKVEEKITAEAEKEGFAWYQILPCHGAGAFLGLADKYVGFMAVKDVQIKENRMTGIMKEQGNVGFLSAKEPVKVLCNGEDVTASVKKENMIYTIELEPENKKAVVEVIWQEDRCSY